jgi:hypothetical protein
MAKSKLQVTEFNCETGKEIVRDLTADEIAQMESDAANASAKIADDKAKTAQRQAILDKLGLSADEAKLLIG